jgi:hypothetical protein
MTVPGNPLWRQAYDAAERRVTPHADRLVRTPSFAVGTALVRRVHSLARSSAQGVTARAWHLLNLPAGSDVTHLRTQIGALDREVRRLTVQLETERRRPPTPTSTPTSTRRTSRRATTGTGADTEERHADAAQPAGGPRPGPEGRRTQRPAGT